jgi:hypothetical protein
MDENRKEKLIKLSRRATFRADDARRNVGGDVSRNVALRRSLRRTPLAHPGAAGDYRMGNPEEIIETHEEEVSSGRLTPGDRRRIRQERREGRRAEKTTLRTEEVASERYQDAPRLLRRRQRIQLDPSGELSGEFGRWESSFAAKYSSDNVDQAGEFILDLENVISGIQGNYQHSAAQKAWAFMHVMKDNSDLMSSVKLELGSTTINSYLRIFERMNNSILQHYADRRSETGMSEHAVVNDIRRMQTRAGKGLKHWRN